MVSLLTYLLAKKDLTVEEVNGLAIDVVFGGVDTVSKLFVFATDSSQIVGSDFFQSTDPWKLYRFIAMKIYVIDNTKKIFVEYSSNLSSYP